MLVLRKSVVAVAKLGIKLCLGRVFSFLQSCHDAYQLRTDHSRYQFHGARMSDDDIALRDKYVSDCAPGYKAEQLSSEDIERTSQYYIFGRIEKDAPRSVCNIGCFYCGSDNRFLQKNPAAKVYGLDFGNIVELNRNIAHERLLLYPGYPLATLERLQAQGVRFDYAIMARTATLINIEQLLSYMKVLAPMAKNIVFLEVGKLTTSLCTSLDVNKIELMDPVKMYSGMYIHNYPELLRRNGYEIVEEKVLHYNDFNQIFSPDHDFLYVHGRRANA